MSAATTAASLRSGPGATIGAPSRETLANRRGRPKPRTSSDRFAACHIWARPGSPRLIGPLERIGGVRGSEMPKSAQRQPLPGQRQEEDRDVDEEADIPEDRA